MWFFLSRAVGIENLVAGVLDCDLFSSKKMVNFHCFSFKDRVFGPKHVMLLTF